MASITDELREWASNNLSYKTRFDELIAIADRIDAEHEKAMSRAGQLLADAENDRDYNYANWQECKQKVLQGNITFDELNARIECLEDELTHCIELPRDADGVPIRVGDVVENLREDLEPALHHRFKVYGIQYRAYEQACTLTEDGFPTILYRANECRHYHAPTVEDLLMDLLSEAEHFHSLEEERDAISDYASRLRLAGDAE